jgi:hypothetical protein
MFITPEYIIVRSFRVQYLGSAAQGQNAELYTGWIQRRPIAADIT